MFKTNSTADRVDYSNMLLPPEGYTLDFAVGTTYSLDLETLTAVCIALGLNEETDSTLAKNPICMLNALQKASRKILVFCEAGQIHMPKKPRDLSLLLEKMLVPVALPKAKGLNHFPAFHPKTWVIRYVNSQGEYHYRFAALSRNLTFDRSWDVCFAMDSSPSAKNTKKTKPIISFVEFLQKQITPSTQNARGKRKVLRELCEELKGVSFELNSRAFGESFEVLPLGIGAGSYNMRKDPLMCEAPSNLVVFSPFVSGSLIEFWNKTKYPDKEPSRVLITRKSELSKLTPETSTNFKIYTLSDYIVDGEEALSDEATQKQKQDIHAKIYLRNNLDIYLGSMNATYSAANYNVEMMVKLHTNGYHYSIARFLEDIGCTESADAFFESAAPMDATEDDEQEATNRLEHMVKLICRMSMSAFVSQSGEKYNVSLRIDGQIPDGDITIAPFRRNVPVALKNEISFEQLDLLQLSEFYVVRVTCGDMHLERIIMVPTEGIPAERESAVVNSVVNGKRPFLEYVAFVLGDNHLLALVEEHTLSGGGNGEQGFEGEVLPAIYEKMLKTALEEPEKIGEIGYLLKMITKEDVVPQEFRELYETFRRLLKLK